MRELTLIECEFVSGGKDTCKGTLGNIVCAVASSGLWDAAKAVWASRTTGGDGSDASGMLEITNAGVGA
jgi:hypothetical protein